MDDFSVVVLTKFKKHIPSQVRLSRLVSAPFGYFVPPRYKVSLPHTHAIRAKEIINLTKPRI